MTTLAAHYRGDHFEMSFTLGNGWTGATFTSSVKFTLRTVILTTSTSVDTDAVDQSSVANGEITFVGAVGTIKIPPTRTTLWPVRTLYWDLQGVVTGPPLRVYTIDSGLIPILGDVTRSA